MLVNIPYMEPIGMGIDDGLHLPRLNGKPILVIFCEPLPSFEGIVSFTTSYSCTSPKYSGTSEWPRWSSSWYITKLCRMIMIIIDSNIVKRDLGSLVSNFLFINSIIFILFNHFLNLWVICSPHFNHLSSTNPRDDLPQTHIHRKTPSVVIHTELLQVATILH